MCCVCMCVSYVCRHVSCVHVCPVCAWVCMHVSYVCMHVSCAGMCPVCTCVHGCACMCPVCTCVSLCVCVLCVHVCVLCAHACVLRVYVCVVCAPTCMDVRLPGGTCGFHPHPSLPPGHPRLSRPPVASAHLRPSNLTGVLSCLLPGQPHLCSHPPRVSANGRFQFQKFQEPHGAGIQLKTGPSATPCQVPPPAL